MGHDVEIVGTNVVLYISGNFSRLDEKYGGIYRIHGHPGRIVEKIVTRTIQKANADGFFASTPDETNSNWGWGRNDNDFLPENEFIGVFLYHMNSFLQAAKEYPNNIFRSDQVYTIIPFEDDDLREILISRGIESDDKNVKILKILFSNWNLATDPKIGADFWSMLCRL